MSSQLKLSAFVLAAGFTVSGLALGNNAESAGNLQAGILQAKEVVDRAIAATGAGGGGQPGEWPGNGGGGGQPGGWPGNGGSGGQPGGWPGNGGSGGQPGGWPGNGGGGGQPGGWPGNGGGGNNGPWLVNPDALSELLESDQIGLPIMVTAAGSLSQAASFADQSKLAFLQANFQLGNYRFAQACNSMGLSRSQIARANSAAMLPPAGLLAAFGEDLKATVIELNNLRASQGCP